MEIFGVEKAGTSREKWTCGSPR